LKSIFTQNHTIMKTISPIVLIALSFLVLFSCSSDDDRVETPQLTYTITNFAGGAVDVQADAEDNEVLGIAQPIPSLNATEAFPVNMPVILFFNDKIYLNSIQENFSVTSNGNIVGGNISIGEAANGFAVLTFTPYESYTPNSEIVVELKANLEDDGGNGLETDYVLSFSVANFSSNTFDNNSSFENASDGVVFVGDGDVETAPIGCLSATDGSNFAAFTSGDALVSSDAAIGGASSLAVLGPISSDISTVTFKYNFLSAEFQEFVGSVFDDSFVATVVGPNGAYVEVVDSVNQVGMNNTQCNGFPNFPDNGDAYAGETGWISKTMNFSQVGTPAYIIFTVTDVTDTIFSSVIGLDEVTFN